jgi:hypothetical protein
MSCNSGAAFHPVRSHFGAAHSELALGRLRERPFTSCPLYRATHSQRITAHYPLDDSTHGALSPFHRKLSAGRKGREARLRPLRPSSRQRRSPSPERPVDCSMKVIGLLESLACSGRLAVQGYRDGQLQVIRREDREEQLSRCTR